MFKLRRSKILYNTVVELIATCFYVGKIPIAPGTFGSIIAFPLCYMLMAYNIIPIFELRLTQFSPDQNNFINISLNFLLITTLLFLLGIYMSSQYVKLKNKEDPKEVVIDELVGQMFVITLIPLSVALLYHSDIERYLLPWQVDLIFMVLMPLGLFRFYDILKPYPISWLDKNIKGGLGIMLDDLLAAFFAIVMQYAIILVIVDLAL